MEIGISWMCRHLDSCWIANILTAYCTVHQTKPGIGELSSTASPRSK